MWGLIGAYSKVEGGREEPTDGLQDMQIERSPYNPC